MALHFSFALEAAASRTAFAFAFLLTYVLHSVIWCAAAAVAARSGAFAPATQSYFFLAALLGPLLTTTIAITASPAAPHVRDVELLSFAAPTFDGPAAQGGGVTPGITPSSRPWILAPIPGFESQLSGVLLALAVASILGGLRFLIALTALKWRLRDRVEVDDPRILQRLHRLRNRAGLRHVTLTQSAA
ncbi:MAG TPA: hypothetical protein VGP15_21855, partial [Burkholderiales bacterium]|nr:hypothetical protein [Burkholderiales bacterium]